MGWLDQIHLWLGHGKYRAAPTAVADGQVVPLLTDPYGRLRIAAESLQPTGYRRTGNALEYRAVAKASPGSLLEIYGFNSDDTNAFAFQIFNNTAFPSADEVPLVSIYLKPGDNFSFTPAFPLAFSTGITWALSSNPAKYASVTSPKIWAAVAYL